MCNFFMVKEIVLTEIELDKILCAPFYNLSVDCNQANLIFKETDSVETF